VPKILIVDDSRIMTRLLDYMLRAEGYETTVAGGGEEAIKMLAAEPHDLVLLDLMMPIVDGIETLRRIRSTPDTAALPVIMLTAKAQESSRLRAMSEGANDYLTKPFVSSTVLNVVASHCPTE
jgi:two-component system, OmpR family, phosphate regulon response regulator PhoB